jgi:hypothetical protein
VVAAAERERGKGQGGGEGKGVVGLGTDASVPTDGTSVSTSTEGENTPPGPLGRSKRSLWLDQEFALQLKGSAVLALHPSLTKGNYLLYYLYPIYILFVSDFVYLLFI